MERLTERDEYGNADIIGVDSADLQLNLEFDEFNQVTEALNRLAAYEDTGLTPEEVETSLKAVFNRCAALTRGGMCIFCELRNLCDKKRTVYNTREEAEAALAKEE